MSQQWELGRYSKASAVESSFAGLVVLASGEKPTPGFDVRLRAVKGTDVPTFRLEWRDEGGAAADVETSYDAAAVLRDAPDTDKVIIESRQGRQSVRVEHFITAENGGGEVPIPFSPKPDSEGERPRA